MRDTVHDGPIKRGAICACLATGNDLDYLDDGISKRTPSILCSVLVRPQLLPIYPEAQSRIKHLIAKFNVSL